MILHQPSVALTDLVLAVESILIFYLLPSRTSAVRLRNALRLLFAALAGAALLGFVVHGFLVDKSSLAYRLSWIGTLLAIGVMTFAMVWMATRLCCTESAGRWIVRASLLLLSGYALLVLLGFRRFGLAVAVYLPALLFLLTAFVIQYRCSHIPGSLLGAISLLLSVLAAAVQQSGVSLHPEYLDHNTLYHLIQAVALWILYLAGKRLLQPPAGRALR